MIVLDDSVGVDLGQNVLSLFVKLCDFLELVLELFL